MSESWIESYKDRLVNEFDWYEDKVKQLSDKQVSAALRLEIDGIEAANISRDKLEQAASLLMQPGIDKQQIPIIVNNPQYFDTSGNIKSGSGVEWTLGYDESGYPITTLGLNEDESVSAIDQWTMGFQESEAARDQAQFDTKMAQDAYQFGNISAADQASLALQGQSITQNYNLALQQYEQDLAQFEWEKQFKEQEFQSQEEQNAWTRDWAEILRQDQLAVNQWEQEWSMAQAPDTGQPSGFAGWGQEYEWSPAAEMNTGEGWLTSPMSYQERTDPTLYGSDAWAEQAANWWDVAQIEKLLAQENASLQRYNTNIVPSVVANYFQGIDPWQYATSVPYEQAGGNPYQWESMPTLSSLAQLTKDQLKQLQSGAENLHSKFNWDDVLKNAYTIAPPEQQRTTLLY